LKQAFATANFLIKWILSSIKNNTLLKAKKSYGQHFLTNESIASQIGESLIKTDLYDQVLEIGPGRGMLTKYLMKQPYNLTLVEADQDMVFYLKKYFPELKSSILEGDFLKLNITAVFNQQPLAIIGNFPYNISSQILFQMLEHKDYIPELVGMFQKEVAERVIAPPGNKVYGVISVLVQAYYEGALVLHVTPNNFDPPPKVQSAVIRLVRKENQDLGCDYKSFRMVVKSAFSQRRKMLRNTMKPFLKGDPLLENDFFTQRPERLSVADFVKLTNWVEARQKDVE